MGALTETHCGVETHPTHGPEPIVIPAQAGISGRVRAGIDGSVPFGTGIDFAGLQSYVTQSAANGIYRAIGREEAAIRANSRETGDPVITGVFGALR